MHKTESHGLGTIYGEWRTYFCVKGTRRGHRIIVSTPCTIPEIMWFNNKAKNHEIVHISWCHFVVTEVIDKNWQKDNNILLSPCLATGLPKRTNKKWHLCHEKQKGMNKTRTQTETVPTIQLASWMNDSHSAIKENVAFQKYTETKNVALHNIMSKYAVFNKM